MLPPNIDGFLVHSFDSSGFPREPDGTFDDPIVFATNRALGGIGQVGTILALMLATVYRRSISSNANDSLSANLQAQVQNSMERAREDSRRLLTLFEREPSPTIIQSAFQDCGYQVSLAVQDDLRPELEDYRKACRFFAWTYNEIDLVRDAIDRAVFAAVGSGTNIVSPSETIRTILEKRRVGLATDLFIAQSIRDAQLFGTSCFVINSDADLSIRLIRPDKIGFETDYLGDLRIRDELGNESWSLSRDSVKVMRGIEQRSSPFGVSILEPVLATLARVLETRQLLFGLLSTPTDVTPTFVQDSSPILQRVHELYTQAEIQLEAFLELPLGRFALPRTGLYFPGWQKWHPDPL